MLYRFIKATWVNVDVSWASLQGSYLSSAVANDKPLTVNFWQLDNDYRFFGVDRAISNFPGIPSPVR